MSQLTDQAYLRTEQYRDASNLDARICVHQLFSTNGYPWHRWVFDQFDLQRRCVILDVGCGPGDLWVENEDRIPAGWTITLSDMSPGMLQKARHNLHSSHRTFGYCVVDAQDIPFPGESFEAVIANHVLYHVPDEDRALYEIHRVLRPGGHLYAATNGLDHLRELRDLVTRFDASADTPIAAAEFGLENGEAQLSRHFTCVTRHRRDDALVVTEAEPLVAYARSMMGETALRQNIEAFSRLVHERIAARGAIHIQKDSGLFIATKG
jgi:SAM-dependent methyltransferase